MRGLVDSDRVYLRPLLTAGGVDFSRCEVVVRRAGGELWAGSAAVEEVRRWSASANATVGERVARLLDAGRAPRPTIAGIRLDRPRIMGVINVTPDSFSDGGDHPAPAAAIAHGRALAAAGADILDVGGESARPGARPTSIAAERARVLPVIEGLRATGRPISIDTRKADIMRAALDAGAAVVNDISALTHDPNSLAVVAASSAPVVLMHAAGQPATMQQDPHYSHVLLDVFDYLEARIAACAAAGIANQRVIVDPGIGFGKTLDHNLALLRGLAMFRTLGCPLLIGVSRKSFIGRLDGVAEPKRRLAGSLAAGLWALAQGADVLRVHDVAETAQAIAVWQAAADGAPSPTGGRR